MAPQARKASRIPACGLLLFLAACCAAPAPGAGAATEVVSAKDGPDGQALYQWNPSESWPGGAQFDARLDQPVRFWRAGLALTEVFASIEQQTGVKLSFWPQGDENPRVRVNLYLNPERPPTLRDLMAQLMWVTDCTFAYRQQQPEELGASYYLLGTSIGTAAQDLQVVEQEARDHLREVARRNQNRNAEEVRANLEELRRALKLSRDEAIGRYKDKDDYLLLTLLDPCRRAAAEYVCKVMDPEHLLRSSRRKWEELTDEERVLIGQAMLQFDEEDWPAKTEVQIWADYSQPSMEPWARIELTAGAKVAQDRQGRPTFRGIGVPYTVAPTRDLALRELERAPLEFARALGKRIAKDEKDAYVRQWKTSLWKKQHEQQLKALVAATGLSPAKAKLLSSLTLPLEQGRAYALWELQEAVAAASGLNVISDCFWHPRRPLQEADSTLHALAFSCQAMEDRAHESRNAIWLAESEWGDAGSFLRFRSTERGVWRASLLSPQTLAQLDACLAPYLPEASTLEGSSGPILLRFAVDLPELFRIASSLDDVQLGFGGRLIYEDPADPMGACRQALRQAFLDVDSDGMTAVRWGARPLNFFRLVASFTEGQWKLLRGDGLNCAKLSKDQLARLRNSMQLWGDDYMENPSGLVLKAEGPLPTHDPKSTGAALPPMIWKRVGPGHYTRIGDTGGDALPPHSFYVRLQHAKGEMESVLPEGETEQGSITSWSCDYQVEVNVPRPLQPAEAPQQSS